MTLRKTTLALALSLPFAFASVANASNSLVQQATQEKAQQQQHNQQREAGFVQTAQELQAAKAELLAERNRLQKEADQLSSQFSDNENTLARLEETLRLETGSLGEMFGVVRQNAKELQSELDQSVTGVEPRAHQQSIDDVVAAKTLPSMAQLRGLWQAMSEEIRASGQVQTTEIQWLNGQGETLTVPALRLGSLGLISEQGYVKWDNARQQALSYQQLPSDFPTFSHIRTLVDGDVVTMKVDPSRGVLLEQLALTPTLSQRLQAGGVIGNVILVLLGVGLIIALYRGAILATLRQKIKAQLKNPEQPGNNPLGRILAVYNKEQQRSVEALELRLLEAVVDEQNHLETGLSMLKLLAALAPMLGLLGTVTGMIETFQVITQFGNGDPKVMAGGISMALVTTVEGLIAAIPLLLAHNILSAQAEAIRNILEKQGIGLVAQQAERDCGAAVTQSRVEQAA
ncbi:TPA: MotA/TolQ/ExbB proton channel family protein [Vibrio cholerae]|uniref:MotA/TolQ/ExbB proton channel family protein n=1 Tax=Vibrio cholerae TaxID=666 RepID=UPI00019F73E0|nr:MotA/TolQ/ExbB proton channel family protein [Vibrio cholerae]EEO12614.1 MotA/TolQ/ExbB proton channel family protein [Vibrio cholerae TMA 21]EGQ9323828.1 MotA/TolQ/ExbB proton channel family protein [Vibrio cholerae]EGR0160168.1 MotA/TolQ/ExbB proton channel family protein [Vibrio cholerae]EGR0519422.1 MotA/TolQ/ExbB proton channel family protein [Vibrio cholerae]EGR4150386.1 MotA/TolQ/ExbB proton channel family protein [Vibrio cholerae]